MQKRDKQSVALYLSLSLMSELRQFVADSHLSASSATAIAIREWIDREKQRKAVGQ